jgi:hypothetical protein
MTAGVRMIILSALACAASAAPLLPGHLPVGAMAPLEAGQPFTLAATRTFAGPSFTDSSHVLRQDRRATALECRDGFYRLRLEAQDGQTARVVWVYRSELEVKDALAKVADPLPERLALGPRLRPLAAGDTLTLAGALLYEKPDLLGSHRQLAGRTLFSVTAAENSGGFLQVKADGTRGWLHRAEVPEDRRKPR